MKHKMRILIIAAALLMLSGRAAEKPAPENSFSESNPAQTETVQLEKPDEESKSTEVTEIPPTLQEPVENNAPNEKLSEQKPQATASPQQPQTEPEPPIAEPEISPPAEEPEQTIPQTSEPQSQESEAPESIPEQEKPQIRIEEYIAFGKDYAQTVGLAINPEAIYCWDTPITASDPDYLKRDIKSRLNRYANSGEVTEVWLWAEDNGNGGYLLYIGYA